MQISELIEFIDKENVRLIEYFSDQKTDSEKLILYRTVKIGEEFGELCDAILASSSSQRKDKLAASTDNLEDEFADVLFTTLLLARMMKIDIEESLNKKIEKINQRYD